MLDRRPRAPFRPIAARIRISIRALGITLALVGAATAPALRAAELHVFAAASLADALTDYAPLHEAATGDKLVLNLAASSLLARQIQEGAPADLFFSADEAKMDALARAGLLLADTRRSVLANSLVIVVPAPEAAPDASEAKNASAPAPLATPADLAGPSVRRIALAEPSTVPAGIYAREFLTRAGLWKTVSAKVVPTANARACLAAVEAGNADAGIVYRTDALASRRVRVACRIAVADGPAISYPLAVVKNSAHPDAARRLAARLASPEALAIFEKHGFLPAPSATPAEPSTPTDRARQPAPASGAAPAHP